ncbi:hypothetical protein [Streptomyces noursei]|uniref:hypothetical protein n=1 Tax=Streptomyces noursei TaxID=1971 RepID=UPI003811D73E
MWVPYGGLDRSAVLPRPAFPVVGDPGGAARREQQPLLDEGTSAYDATDGPDERS